MATLLSAPFSDSSAAARDRRRWVMPRFRLGCCEVGVPGRWEALSPVSSAAPRTDLQRTVRGLGVASGRLPVETEILLIP